MKIDPSIKPLVDTLADAFQQLHVLRFDEDHPGVLGAPCTDAQISKVAADIRVPLPPSYESFLRLHNGWTHFVGEASLLAVEDRQVPWYAPRLRGIQEHLAEFGRPDFIATGFPILVHRDVSDVAYFDKSKPTVGGELETVYTSLRSGEWGRFPSFKAFLEAMIGFTNTEIAAEKA